MKGCCVYIYTYIRSHIMDSRHMAITIMYSCMTAHVYTKSVYIQHAAFKKAITQYMVESKWLYTTQPVLNCTTHRNIPLACLMNMYLGSNEQHNTISLAIGCASPSAQTSTLCGVKLVRDAVYYFGGSRSMPFGLMNIVPHPLCMLPNVISAKW